MAAPHPAKLKAMIPETCLHLAGIPNLHVSGSNPNLRRTHMSVADEAAAARGVQGEQEQTSENKCLDGSERADGLDATIHLRVRGKELLGNDDQEP